MNKIFLSIAVTAFVFVASGCKPHKVETPKATPAVQLSKKMSESDLAVVTLTPDAEKRLGVETIPTVRRKVDLARSFGGEVILPLVRAGAKDDKSIYALSPAMTPVDLMRTAQMQVDADGQVAAGRVQLEAAQVALKRAEELVTSKAGVGRAVDEARAQVALAEAAWRTTQERRALLGAPVFDAVKSKQLWLRVSVYVGELPQIKTDAPATVGMFGGAANAPTVVATPVAVPFSAAPNPAIAELFYELKSSPDGLRPGVKVAVTLPLQGSEESLVVPAAAILYDVHGNTWVYENIGPHAYTRRRVEVKRNVGPDAILGRGPAPGAKIVTAGAAEIFGTEFGAGK